MQLLARTTLAARRPRPGVVRATALALGLLAALAPIAALAATDEADEAVRGFQPAGTFGWLMWFTVLGALGLWLTFAPNEEAHRKAWERARTRTDTEGPIPFELWLLPAALASAWALSGFDVLGAFSSVGEAVTLAHGILLLIIATALLVPPVAAVARVRGAADGCWKALNYSGVLMMALSAAGALVVIIWNPTFWFTLTEHVWLAASLGSLAWWAIWAIVAARSAGRDGGQSEQEDAAPGED